MDVFFLQQCFFRKDDFKGLLLFDQSCGKINWRKAYLDYLYKFFLRYREEFQYFEPFSRDELIVIFQNAPLNICSLYFFNLHFVQKMRKRGPKSGNFHIFNPFLTLIWFFHVTNRSSLPVWHSILHISSWQACLRHSEYSWMDPHIYKYMYLVSYYYCI